MTQVETKTITAKPRKLKVSWTYEISQDLRSVLKPLRSTHAHEILKFSSETYLGIVRRRNKNKKWYELKMLGDYQWDKEGSVTISTMKRLYGPSKHGHAWKFRTLKEINQAFTWVILNRDGNVTNNIKLTD